MRFDRHLARGGVVIFALMVSLLIFSFAAALLTLNLVSHRSVNKSLDGDIAYYIAEAAANKSIHELNDNNGSTTGNLGSMSSPLCWLHGVAVSSCGCGVTKNSYYSTVQEGNPTVVTAHSFYNGVERILQITLKPKSTTVVAPFLAAVEATSLGTVSNLGQECRYFTYAGHDPTTGVRLKYPKDINGSPPATGDMKGIDFKDSFKDPITSTDQYGTFGLILKGWYGAMPDCNINPTSVFGDVKIQGTWSNLIWNGSIQGYFYHGDSDTGRATSTYDPSTEPGHQNLTFDDLPPKPVDDVIADLRAATGIADKPRTYEMAEAELAAASSLLAKTSSWTVGIDQPYNASTNPNGYTDPATVTVTLKKNDGTLKTAALSTFIDADGDLTFTSTNCGSGYEELTIPAGNYYFKSILLNTGRLVHFGGGSKVFVYGTDPAWSVPHGIRMVDNSDTRIQFDGNGDLAIVKGLGTGSGQNKYVRAGGTTMAGAAVGGDFNLTVGEAFDVTDNNTPDSTTHPNRIDARSVGTTGGNLTVNLPSTDTVNHRQGIEFGADKTAKVNADHLGAASMGGLSINAKERFDIYVRQDFIYGATTGSQVFEGAVNRNSYLMVKGNAAVGPGGNTKTWGYNTNQATDANGNYNIVTNRRNPRERMIFVKGIDASGSIKGGRSVDVNNIDEGSLLVYAPGLQASVGTTGASSITGAIICGNLAIDGGRYLHAYDSTLSNGLAESTVVSGYDLANTQQLK